MRSKGRYYEIDFPGIKNSQTFHNIKAKSFYLSLHDELHRQLVSSIPNACYDAMLEAIEVVREKTGIKWSKELWDATDFEVDTFLGLAEADRNSLSTKSVSSHFLSLSDSTVASEMRPIGLFNNNPLLETNWILMIDMFLRKDFWLSKKIDPNEFQPSSWHRVIYDFIVQHQSLLNDKQSPVEQVFTMMNLYLSQKGILSEEKYHENIIFSKQKGENYLQLRDKRDKKLCFWPKKELLKDSGIYIFAILNNIKLNTLSDSTLERLKDYGIRDFIQQKLLSVDELKRLSDKKIGELKDYNIGILIQQKLLSVDELERLSDKTIGELKDYGIRDMIQKKLVSVDELDKLSDKTIERLKDYGIRDLIQEKRLSVDELDKLSDKTIESLRHYGIRDLIQEKRLSVDELERLSDITIERLKDYGIRGLIKEKILSVDEMEKLSDRDLKKLVTIVHDIKKGEDSLSQHEDDYILLDFSHF